MNTLSDNEMKIVLYALLSMNDRALFMRPTFYGFDDLFDAQAAYTSLWSKVNNFEMKPK